jgi:hypothetical protein
MPWILYPLEVGASCGEGVASMEMPRRVKCQYDIVRGYFSLKTAREYGSDPKKLVLSATIQEAVLSAAGCWMLDAGRSMVPGCPVPWGFAAALRMVE